MASTNDKKADQCLTVTTIGSSIHQTFGPTAIFQTNHVATLHAPIPWPCPLPTFLNDKHSSLSRCPSPGL
uniref:Uncharacterized protein n=1 Tax=Aegilops tauschii subsp. strangulata TaxID=200361 RepID=A0A453LIB1_AEGTS